MPHPLHGRPTAVPHDRLDGAPLGTAPDGPDASWWHRREVPYYGLDIETDTTVDGLDPARAAVVAVAVTTPFDPPLSDTVLTGPEPELLADLDALLDRLPPGVVVTWNGASFDLPFLAERARRAGVPLGLELATDPPAPGRRHGEVRARWGAHRHLDGYRLYRADVGRTLGFSCGLKPMARLVGLEPVEVDREQIHLLSPGELHDYVTSDARLACELVRRRLPGAALATDPWSD